MKPEDKIKLFFKQADLSIDSDADEKVYQDIFQAQQKTMKNTPATPVNIWRIIMKSPLSKIAAAAAVIIACIAGLTMFNKTSGIALADVLTLIEQASSCTFQTERTGTALFNGKLRESYYNRTDIVSREYGHKHTYNNLVLDANDGTIISETSEQIYTLLHEQIFGEIDYIDKTYREIKLTEADIEDSREHIEGYYLNPNRIVERMLRCKYSTLSRTTMDGIVVEGFQTNDPNYIENRQAYSTIDAKLWVDVTTHLPARVEVYQQGKERDMYYVMHSFIWNFPVDSSDFEPNIPENYVDKRYKNYTEEVGIEGLRLNAEIIGRYPENPDIEILVALKQDGDTAETKELQEAIEKLEPEEKTALNSGIGGFYKRLVSEGKDPVYYGEIVSPEDTGQVLLRWKVSDNEYRVIFGNLEAVTVDKDVMFELETTLPK